MMGSHARPTWEFVSRLSLSASMMGERLGELAGWTSLQQRSELVEHCESDWLGAAATEPNSARAAAKTKAEARMVSGGRVLGRTG